MSLSSTTKTQGQSPRFDKISFIKYMKNIGRAYRKQATELVSICRTFVQAQEQAFDPDADRSLRVALQAVDDALKSASEAGTKISEEVDDKLKWVTELLHVYATDWHPRSSSCDKSKYLTVKERMAEAKTKDGSTSSILDTLKEKLLKQPAPNGWSKPTTIVEFLVFKSLPDDKPTVVKQMLGEGSNLSEVLWNFSRYKDSERRLTLKENPHFYKDLPRRSRDYGDDFRGDPIDSFLDTPEHKIFVLTDRQGRIYLETGPVPRAFGNVWCPQNSIIFKDVCGKLEGEGIVGSSIKGKLDLRCCVSAPAEGNPTDWKPLQDWREPIRRLLKSPDRDVGSLRIGTKQSSPPKRLQIPPTAPNYSPSGLSNLPGRASSRHSPSSASSRPVTTGISSNHRTVQPPPRPPPPSSTPTEPRPVTVGLPSNHETARSPPPSTPIQPRPTAAVGVRLNHGTAPQFPLPSLTPTQPRLTVTAGIISDLGTAPQFPLPSSTPTQPWPTGISSTYGTAHSSPSSTPTQLRPAVTTAIPSNIGTAQFPPHSQQSILTSSLPDRATPPLAAPGLLIPTPPNQHHLTPPNVTPERQSQTFNISLSVAVAPCGVTSSHKPHTGSTRNVASYADPIVSKPQGPTSKAPKSNATLPPPQMQQQKPAQRPVWQMWVQKVWKGGK